MKKENLPQILTVVGVVLAVSGWMFRDSYEKTSFYREERIGGGIVTSVGAGAIAAGLLSRKKKT